MTKAELYQKACMLPLLPGVYIIRDKSDTIIYIGKAKRLRIRVSQYFREGVPHDNKVSQMIAHAYAFDVIVCQSEFEALVLEASQIKAHTPKYNILLKDDKGYSYIKVTREAWPRLSFVLQKDEDDAEYIGPYTSSFAARQMAETALDAFLLPRCSALRAMRSPISSTRLLLPTGGARREFRRCACIMHRCRRRCTMLPLSCVPSRPPGCSRRCAGRPAAHTIPPRSRMYSASARTMRSAA